MMIMTINSIVVDRLPLALPESPALEDVLNDHKSDTYRSFGLEPM
jgi:hypothetical protein